MAVCFDYQLSAAVRGALRVEVAGRSYWNLNADLLASQSRFFAAWLQRWRPLAVVAAASAAASAAAVAAAEDASGGSPVLLSLASPSTEADFGGDLAALNGSLGTVMWALTGSALTQLWNLLSWQPEEAVGSGALLQAADYFGASRARLEAALLFASLYDLQRPLQFLQRHVLQQNMPEMAHMSAQEAVEWYDCAVQLDLRHITERLQELPSVAAAIAAPHPTAGGSDSSKPITEVQLMAPPPPRRPGSVEVEKQRAAYQRQMRSLATLPAALLGAVMQTLLRTDARRTAGGSVAALRRRLEWARDVLSRWLLHAAARRDDPSGRLAATLLDADWAALCLRLAEMAAAAPTLAVLDVVRQWRLAAERLRLAPSEAALTVGPMVAGAERFFGVDAERPWLELPAVPLALRDVFLPLQIGDLSVAEYAALLPPLHVFPRHLLQRIEAVLQRHERHSELRRVLLPTDTAVHAGRLLSADFAFDGRRFEVHCDDRTYPNPDWYDEQYRYWRLEVQRTPRVAREPLPGDDTAAEVGIAAGILDPADPWGVAAAAGAALHLAIGTNAKAADAFAPAVLLRDATAAQANAPWALEDWDLNRLPEQPLVPVLVYLRTVPWYDTGLNDWRPAPNRVLAAA